MKSCKPLLLTLCLIAGLSVPALAHEDPEDANEQLKEKIVKMIDHPDLTGMDGAKFHAELEFIITRHNEVLVLCVYTNDKFFDTYIKEKLNYQHLRLRGVKKMQPYKLHVTFVQP